MNIYHDSVIKGYERESVLDLLKSIFLFWYMDVNNFLLLVPEFLQQHYLETFILRFTGIVSQKS